MTLLLERTEAIVACFVLYFYLLCFFSTVVKLLGARESPSGQNSELNLGLYGCFGIILLLIILLPSNLKLRL